MEDGNLGLEELAGQAEAESEVVAAAEVEGVAAAEAEVEIVAAAEAEAAAEVEMVLAAEAEAAEDFEQNPSACLQFRDGSQDLVRASTLAELFPGFIFPLLAVENERVYSVLQAYFVAREHFPSPGREEELMEIILDVGDDEESVDTLGHLAKAAISLGAMDLMDICLARLLILPVTPQIQLILHQINQLLHPIP